MRTKKEKKTAIVKISAMRDVGRYLKHISE